MPRGPKGEKRPADVKGAHGQSKSRIDKSANVALAEQDVIKALTANGFEVVGGKPDVFAKAMSSDIRDVSEIGRKNNLEID